MANSTILYACTHEGLAIFNKPGTLPEWLPPRMALAGQEVTSVWAEPGPPIRVLAAADGALLLSENGGRTWDHVALPGAGASSIMSIFYVADTHTLHAAQYDGTLWRSGDSGASWEKLPGLPAEGCVLALKPVHAAAGQFYALVGESSGTMLYTGSIESGDWRAVDLAGDATKLISIAQAGDAVLYSLTSEGVLALHEDGSFESFQDAPAGGQALAAIPGAAGAPPALVVGTASGIVASPDGGATWGMPELPHTGGVTAFERDPERRDRLYAAVSTGYLLESGNRGASWQGINVQPVGPVGYLFVVRI